MYMYDVCAALDEQETVERTNQCAFVILLIAEGEGKSSWLLTVFLSVFVECRRARAISLSPLIVAAAAVVVDVEARFPASPMIIYRTSVVSYRSLAENRESYKIQMQLLLCMSVCVFECIFCNYSYWEQRPSVFYLVQYVSLKRLLMRGGLFHFSGEIKYLILLLRTYIIG